MLNFQNPKTTVTGLIGGVAMLLSTLHVIDIPAEAQGTIVAGVLTLLGLFSHDAKKEQ